MSLPVLPRPKKVSARQGEFRFAAPLPVVLSGQADDAERLAGLLLADAVADLGGPPPAVERHGRLDALPGPIVAMLLIGRDEKICPDIAKLAGKQKLGPEGYALEVSPRRVLVAAESSAGLFYAAQTLVQLLRVDGPTRAASGPVRRSRGKTGSSRLPGDTPTHPALPWLPACRIVDWPDFRYRGFMLDVSRFRVPKPETLADLVFRLAACKINVLQLYVEHTFHCRRHPEYSAGTSPLTAEQLGELDELCATLHIELQANQNSLGHLQHLLRQPKFAHLAERGADAEPIVDKRGRTLPQPWSFRLDSDQVYDLLDDIYAEHLAAVRSPLVNLGCDEVWDLGRGRSAGLVRRKGRLRAFVDHIKRIRGLAGGYGKRIMIWDDMVRRNPEVLRMLPKDVVPVFWHYGEKPEPDYKRIWSGSGRRHWMAPGCCGWQSIAAQVERAWDNIHWMTRVGKQGGAEGILNTEWGDHGNFQTLAASLISVAIGAELSWNSKPMSDTDNFDRRFARAMFNDATGRMGRLYRALGRTNHVFNHLPYQGPPWLLYWDRFPDGPHLSGVTGGELDRCRKSAEQALAMAHDLRRDPPPGVEDCVFEELISAADQTIFACRKADVAARVRAAQAGAGGRLPASLLSEVRRLAAEWARQKLEFRRVWLLTNQPGQIGFRLGLFDERKGDFRKLLARRGS